MWFLSEEFNWTMILSITFVNAEVYLFTVQKGTGLASGLFPNFFAITVGAAVDSVIPWKVDWHVIVFVNLVFPSNSIQLS